MDPFPPLVALPTNVEHREVHVLDHEVGLDNPRGTHARAEDILLRRDVVGRGEAVDVGEVVLRRVVELKLALPVEGHLHRLIRPQFLEGLRGLGVHHLAVCLPLERLPQRLDICRHFQLDLLKRLEEGVHRGDNVGVDNALEGLSLRLGVAVLVDDLHLLEDGRLARLSRTKQEHLDHLGLRLGRLADGLLSLRVDLRLVGVHVLSAIAAAAAAEQ
mmetsp:Transcript_11246/g.27822  ORF Transcript_11246/g.27822 Transcript_11246/m.27822 type:complete len:216 (-) Transcript_11246:14-661(-)